MRIILFVLLFIVCSSNIQAQHWNITELSAMPEAISNNAVCEGFVNGVPYVYSFAGIDETKIYSGIHNRSYRFNTQTNTWEAIAPLPDSNGGKIAASANRVGDIIYIIGGYHVASNGSEISSEKVHRYNTQTNTYMTDGMPIPIPIDDQVQVVKDSLIYVISGWSNTGNIQDVQIYNTVSDQWFVGSSITWVEVAVFGAAGTIVGDTIYFIGGAQNNDFSIQSRLRKGAINPDNPLEITWTSAPVPFRAYRPAATTANGNAYFLGGADNTYNYNGIAYNNNQGVEPNNRSLVYRPEDQYLEEDLLNSLPMDLRGIANVSDSIKYLAGGMLSNQTVTDKLWKLELIGIPTPTHDIYVETISLTCFPNPAQDFISIKTPNSLNCTNARTEVYDQNGNRLISKKGCSENLPIKSFPNGMFTIKIFNDKTVASGSFIKSN